MHSRIVLDLDNDGELEEEEIFGGGIGQDGQEDDPFSISAEEWEDGRGHEQLLAARRSLVETRAAYKEAVKEASAARADHL
jgi:hypothetical protein